MATPAGISQKLRILLDSNLVSEQRQRLARWAIILTEHWDLIRPNGFLL